MFYQLFNSVIIAILTRETIDISTITLLSFHRGNWVIFPKDNINYSYGVFQKERKAYTLNEHWKTLCVSS